MCPADAITDQPAAAQGSGAQPVPLCWGSAVAHAVTATVAAALIGAGPALWAGGRDALAAALPAGAGVLAVMLATAAIVARAGKDGPAKVAVTFMSLSMVRMILSGAIVAGLGWLTGQDPLALALWAVGFYLACLAGEVVWLVRTVRKTTHAQALNAAELPE